MILSCTLLRCFKGGNQAGNDEVLGIAQSAPAMRKSTPQVIISCLHENLGKGAMATVFACISCNGKLAWVDGYSVLPTQRLAAVLPIFCFVSSSLGEPREHIWDGKV